MRVYCVQSWCSMTDLPSAGSSTSSNCVWKEAFLAADTASRARQTPVRFHDAPDFWMRVHYEAVPTAVRRLDLLALRHSAHAFAARRSSNSRLTPLSLASIVCLLPAALSGLSRAMSAEKPAEDVSTGSSPKKALADVFAKGENGRVFKSEVLAYAGSAT